MEIKYILLLVVLHYIADFILQDEDWATEKSTDDKKLILHTSVYSVATGVGLFFFTLYQFATTGVEYVTPLGILYFTVLTFIFHTLTDYFTSKVVKIKFDQGEYGSAIPNLGAFSIIGFDQLLHIVQLLVTFHIIFN